MKMRAMASFGNKFSYENQISSWLLQKSNALTNIQSVTLNGCNFGLKWNPSIELKLNAPFYNEIVRGLRNYNDC